MRAACIDIGSNTTRLLVADCESAGLHKVAQERAFTHLRRHLAPGRGLDAQALEHVAAVVLAQLEVARRLGASEIVIVATEAVRRSGAAAELAAVVHDHCGVRLDVLSEEQEARFAFIGACAALRESGPERVPMGEIGVVDVGGGSSEIVVGSSPDAVRWSVSRPIGSGVIADACFGHDPPTGSELEAARRLVGEALADVEVPRPQTAVAVGGSAASLLPLAGARLDGAAFRSTLEMLAASSAAEVAGRFGLDPERVALLPAGLLILQAVQGRFGVPLEVVAGGLREGVLMGLARE